MVKIRLCSGQNMWAWIVRAATVSLYSHCDFELPDGTFLGADSYCGRVIRAKDWYYPHVDTIEVPMSPEKELELYKWLYLQLGKPYDYSALRPNTIFKRHKRNWHDNGSWICSELVAGGLRHVGINLFPDDAFKIVPRDVARRLRDGEVTRTLKEQHDFELNSTNVFCF